MKDRDPIASPTLALLYLSQGHFGRARSIVAQLLQRDPHDGNALVLQRRLGARSNARLSCEVEGDRFQLGWQGVETHEDMHVVWVLTTAFTAGSDGFGVGAPLWRVGSQRCTRSFGAVSHPVPWPRGAIACCIARAGGAAAGENGSPAFGPVTVGPVCTWG
jgi:hypothetical protein